MASIQFDSRANILAGYELRVFLNSEHISYGEIHSILKGKGIYVGSTDKSITVPILSSTLLTPDDFTVLIESSIDRESKPKSKNLSLNLSEESANWFECLRSSFLEDDYSSLISHMDNIDFTEMPKITCDKKGLININYKIVRKDYSQDWIKRELKFDGEINISQSEGKNLIEFASTHSSKETEIINRKFIQRLSNILHENKLVSSLEPNLISFNSFSNEERVRFFKRLTSGNLPMLEAGDVDNIEICVDKSVPNFPNDSKVSWMKQTVNRLKIDGEKMNNIFLISEEKYYSFYHIQKMDIIYSFKSGVNTGSCAITFSFSNESRDIKNSEFIFVISKIKYSGITNNDAKKAINIELKKCLHELVEKNYQSILQDRQNPL